MKCAVLVILAIAAIAVGADRPLAEVYREAKEALEAGDAARCVELLEPALKDAQGEVAPAQLALGIAQLRLGRSAEAAEVLTKAAAKMGGTANAPLVFAPLGDALRATGKAEEAKRAYEAAAAAPEAVLGKYGKARLRELDGEDLQKAGKLMEAADAYLAAAEQLLGLGEADPIYRAAARELYEKVAKGTGTPGKDWRGEATARAVLGLGDVERASGHLPEAIAYYQRTFVSWVKYPKWAAQAYLRAADCMDKLGKRAFAIRHLREMVRKVEKYGALPEYQQAKAQLRAWGEDVR